MGKKGFIFLLLFGFACLAILGGCGGGGGGGGDGAGGVLVSVSPPQVTLFTGGTQQFTATVSGSSDPVVFWSVQEGAAGGTIDSNGLYTAPNTPGTYHVVATSRADPSKQGIATITVQPRSGISVSISPSEVTLFTGDRQQFTATVSGSSNPVVFWSVQEGAAGGTIDSNGLYTAPNTPGTYHVVATSRADPTKSAIATITVQRRDGGGGGVSVSISPSEVTLPPGGKQQFTATVRGSPDPVVFWSIQEGASGGTVDSNGLYTAPNTPGTYHVVATSRADPTKRAVATVTVRAESGVSVSISPAEVTLFTGDQQQFTATVTGSADTTVFWSIQEGAAGGVVDSNGLYTAPNTPGTYHVVATSQADPTKSAIATVTVQPRGNTGSGTVIVE